MTRSWDTPQHTSPDTARISHSFSPFPFPTPVPSSSRIFIFHKFYYFCNALDSLDLAFGIQLQSKFLTAISPQHPAQESRSCLCSPCGQGSSLCTQSGVMWPIYDPVLEKEHVSKTHHVHLSTWMMKARGRPQLSMVARDKPLHFPTMQRPTTHAPQLCTPQCLSPYDLKCHIIGNILSWQ